MQSKVIGNVIWTSKVDQSRANEPRNQLNATYAYDMLENAALSVQDNIRDARKGVENGWKEGERPSFDPPIDKQKRSKKQKKKTRRRWSKPSVQNIFERYANLSASQQRKEYPSTPVYLKDIPACHGITTVRSSLGTGKTQATKELCSKYDTVLWLAHRVALTRNTQERLNDNRTMDAFTLYLDKEGNLVENRLIVCVDSIARVARTHDPLWLTKQIKSCDLIVKSPRIKGP